MQYQSYAKEVIEKLKQAEKTTLEAIGLFVEGQAKKIITTLDNPRTGGTGAVDTGNLRSSITHKLSENAVAIGTNVKYAIYIEKGTSKMKGSPYLTPAAENNIDKIEKIARRYMAID